MNGTQMSVDLFASGAFPSGMHQSLPMPMSAGSFGMGNAESMALLGMPPPLSTAMPATYEQQLAAPTQQLPLGAPLSLGPGPMEGTHALGSLPLGFLAANSISCRAISVSLLRKLSVSLLAARLVSACLPCAWQSAPQLRSVACVVPCAWQLAP